MRDLAKWWIVWTLLDWAKLSVVGDASLGAAVMSGAAWLIGHFRGLPLSWQYRAQGFVLASFLLASVSASNFVWARWTVDLREIPSDRLAEFKAALPKDTSEV